MMRMFESVDEVRACIAVGSEFEHNTRMYDIFLNTVQVPVIEVVCCGIYNGICVGAGRR